MLIKGDSVVFNSRPTSISAGVSELGWASNNPTSRLYSGFGVSDGDETVFKILDYEEVIFVMSGVFGVEVNGTVVEAQAGDVLHIPQGSEVRYVSSDARIFFVITNPGK